MTRDERDMYREHLENIVDAGSVTDALDLLHEICEAKAQHIRENWQDEKLAKSWEKDGEKLGKLARKVTH